MDVSLDLDYSPVNLCRIRLINKGVDLDWSAMKSRDSLKTID